MACIRRVSYWELWLHQPVGATMNINVTDEQLVIVFQLPYCGVDAEAAYLPNTYTARFDVMWGTYYPQIQPHSVMWGLQL